MRITTKRCFKILYISKGFSTNRIDGYNGLIIVKKILKRKMMAEVTKKRKDKGLYEINKRTTSTLATKGMA